MSVVLAEHSRLQFLGHHPQHTIFFSLYRCCSSILSMARRLLVVLQRSTNWSPQVAGRRLAVVP